MLPLWSTFGRDLLDLLLEMLRLLAGAFSGRTTMGTFGVHPHSIDGPIDADAAGEPPNGFHRVLGVEIDDLRSLGPCHVEARGDGVDRQDSAGPQELGAEDGELADGAAAKDRHCVPRADLGQFGPEITRWEDVG